MLPFLKHKEAGVQSEADPIERKPDEDKEQEYDSLESAAEELISAVNSKDAKAVCSALRSAFEICQSGEG